MSDKSALSTRTAKASALVQNCDGTVNASKPKPEEGRRLMHAFYEIRNAKVREAIIRYVEEQSRLVKDG